MLADRGYYNREQELEYNGTGTLPCVPIVDTSGRAQRGLFARPDFIYDADGQCTLPHQNAERYQNGDELDGSAYNMKHIIRIFGVQPLIQGIRARSVRPNPLPVRPNTAFLRKNLSGVADDEYPSVR